ncbi:MAG: hypothetical protein II515_09425 [Desulfovibrio sp.]|nr:hypothetical protein [Desulfovibrio sp.]
MLLRHSTMARIMRVRPRTPASPTKLLPPTMAPITESLRLLTEATGVTTITTSLA